MTLLTVIIGDIVKGLVTLVKVTLVKVMFGDPVKGDVW